MEDTEIIDLFWERDETAIQELSNKYFGYCYKIAWNLLENYEDVEECLNDTWFAAPQAQGIACFYWKDYQKPGNRFFPQETCGQAGRTEKKRRLRRARRVEFFLYRGRTDGGEGDIKGDRGIFVEPSGSGP